MNKRKFILALFITLVVLSLCYAAYTFLSSDTSFQEALDRSGDGKINILVIGVDNDKVRSDVNMLFSLNTEEKTINLLSIPRDTRVKVSKTAHSKINSCLGRKNGETLLIENVKELTGMPVHNFCKVDFEGLRNIIDILGGVEFDVPIDMDYDDPVQDLSIHLKKGKQVLNGAQAEGLLRYRKSYPNADLGRIDVQQAFIKEAIRQKLNIRYILKAFPLMKEINESLETDMSFVYMLKCAWQFRDKNELTFQSFTLPGNSKTIGGASYYVCDKKKTEELVKTVFGYKDGKSVPVSKNTIQ